MEPIALEQHIAELEVAIDRLRSLYDQYFMGIERLEPQVPRKEVDRKIHILRKEQIRNTALRFRFQMLLQRYSMFQSLWQRICRDIENGTYKRQLIRSGLRRVPGIDNVQVPAEASLSGSPPASPLPEPGAPPSGDLAAELEELDKDFAPVAGKSPPDGRQAPARAGPAGGRITATPLKPAVTVLKPNAALKPPTGPGQAKDLPSPRPPPLTAPAQAKSTSPTIAKATASPPTSPKALQVEGPPPHRGDGLPEYRVRQLYVEYVEAKRRQKESTAAITYEGLAESLRASSAKLREKHGKAVDFEVSIKDGKAILRARMK